MDESTRVLLRRAAKVADKARDYLVDIGPTRETGEQWYEAVDGLADLQDAISAELGALKART